MSPESEEIWAEILKDFTPEERHRGLTPEQLILALPDEMLRGFEDSYLRTLSPEAQQAIRERIGRPD